MEIFRNISGAIDSISIVVPIIDSNQRPTYLTGKTGLIDAGVFWYNSTTASWGNPILSISNGLEVVSSGRYELVISGLQNSAYYDHVDLTKPMIIFADVLVGGDPNTIEIIDNSDINVDITEILTRIGVPSNIAGSGADLAGNMIDTNATSATRDAATDAKIDTVEGKIDIVDSNVDLIVAKLPIGTISDMSFTDEVDGLSFYSILELTMAMANGRYEINTPSAGQVTFYKRDNLTILTVISVSDVERLRIS